MQRSHVRKWLIELPRFPLDRDHSRTLAPSTLQETSSTTTTTTTTELLTTETISNSSENSTISLLSANDKAEFQPSVSLNSDVKGEPGTTRDEDFESQYNTGGIVFLMLGLIIIFVLVIVVAIFFLKNKTEKSSSRKIIEQKVIHKSEELNEEMRDVKDFLRESEENNLCRRKLHEENTPDRLTLNAAKTTVSERKDEIRAACAQVQQETVVHNSKKESNTGRDAKKFKAISRKTGSKNEVNQHKKIAISKNKDRRNQSRLALNATGAIKPQKCVAMNHLKQIMDSAEKEDLSQEQCRFSIYDDGDVSIEVNKSIG